MTILQRTIITAISTLPVAKSTKKKGFNVLVTEEGREKYYLKALEKELKKYPFLKQQCYFRRKTSLSSARYLEVIVFGNNNSYDYTVTNQAECVPFDFISFDLVSDFGDIKKALKVYAQANYPSKFKTSEERTIEITIEIERTAKKEKKARKWDVCRIHDTFVKIGYKTYDIYVDTLTGDEYIKVNGEKIFILEDNNGNKYLA